MTTGAYPIEIFYQKGGQEMLFQKENVGALYRVYLGHLRRISFDTLEDTITFKDAKALTTPVTGTAVFKLHPDWEIEEYECTNERLMFDEHGNQTISRGAQP